MSDYCGACNNEGEIKFHGYDDIYLIPCPICSDERLQKRITDLEALIVEAAEPIAILAKDERDVGRYESSRALFKLVDRMEKYRPIQMPEGGGDE